MIVIDTAHIPPTTNHLFTNLAGRGRVRSKKYKDWAKVAGWDFCRCSPVLGDFRAVITITKAMLRKGSDIDNRIKAVLDLLKEHRLIEDDSRCQELTIRYGETKLGMRVEVESA